VTLPTGLTFSDGSTTKPFTTDASGDITITGVIATDSAATGSISAVLGTVSATAVVTVTNNGTAIIARNGAIYGALGPVSAGSVSVGGGYYLTSAGDLYLGTTLVDTGVSTATGEYVFINGNQTYNASYMKGGVVTVAVNGSVYGAVGPIPAGAVSVGGQYFLTPGGDLYYGTTLVDTGVSTASGEYLIQNSNQVFDAYYLKGGVATIARNGAVYAPLGAIPADAVSVGGGYYLTPGGDFYNGTTLVDTGVSSASGEYAVINSSQNYYGYYVKNGIATIARDGAIYGAVGAVPADAVSVGGGYYLTPGGDFYQNTTLVDSGVLTASGEYLIQNGNQVFDGYYLKDAVC